MSIASAARRRVRTAVEGSVKPRAGTGTAAGAEVMRVRSHTSEASNNANVNFAKARWSRAAGVRVRLAAQRGSSAGLAAAVANKVCPFNVRAPNCSWSGPPSPEMPTTWSVVHVGGAGESALAMAAAGARRER